jgi:cytochrome c oxidase subunit III
MTNQSFLADHFETPRQQFAAGKLGMWIFLLTEILLFGGLFCVYAVYRAHHPEIFTLASRLLDRNLGALNTAVLILSSFTMAWGVRCAQRDRRLGTALCLAATLLCACVFLGVKYVEYKAKWEHGLLWASRFEPVHDNHAADGGHHAAPPQEMSRRVGVFFSIYFMMTGLHGVHVVAGMIAIAWILRRTLRGDFGSSYYGPVDYVGLYWHLVDLIWIYLFPLLYLIH